MEIIDAQVHEAIPWLGYGPQAHTDDEATRNKIGTELVLAQMDAMGISMGMISSNSRLAWGDYAIKAFPERFTEKRRMDPAAPDVEDRVANLRSQRGVLGIRIATGFRNGAVPRVEGV